MSDEHKWNDSLTCASIRVMFPRKISNYAKLLRFPVMVLCAPIVLVFSLFIDWCYAISLNGN